MKDEKYHCNYTREYKGAAQSICNLKYSIPKIVSIAFHNNPTIIIILAKKI